MLVEEILFSAIPGQSDPNVLLTFYQRQLLFGIKIHLSKFAEAIHLDLSSLIEQVSNLDVHQRFSPVLYGIYSRLKSQYENKNVEVLFHVVQSLKNALVQNVYAKDCTFSSFLSESWEEPIILDLKESSPGAIETKKLYPLIHWNQDDFPPPHLQSALCTLRDLDKSLHCEFTTYVSRFKLFSSKVLIACTSAKFFGAIYMRPPLPTEDALIYYLDGLAHEVSHLHLYAMMGIDPMVLNRNDELFSSPLRPDLRPMYGIFHSCFVLARIIRVLRKYEGIGGKVENHLRKKEARFKEACNIVEKKAQLTDKGKQIYQTLDCCAFQN